MATTLPLQVGAKTFTGAPASTPSAAVTIEPVAEATAPNYVAIYSSTILAMSMLFLIGVGLPCAIFLDDFVAGFGIGAFSAVWGGPSFGVMAGSARVSAWHEAHHADGH